MKIKVVVETPSGTTWEQVLVVKESVKKTIADYKKTLGKGYLICSWWEIEE